MHGTPAWMSKKKVKNEASACESIAAVTLFMETSMLLHYQMLPSRVKAWTMGCM